MLIVICLLFIAIWRWQCNLSKALGKIKIWGKSISSFYHFTPGQNIRFYYTVITDYEKYPYLYNNKLVQLGPMVPRSELRKCITRRKVGRQSGGKEIRNASCFLPSFFLAHKLQISSDSYVNTSKLCKIETINRKVIS